VYRGDGHEANEVVQQLVIAGGDASEVFEFVEQSLDHVALLVERPVAGVRISPVLARRDDGRGAGFPNRFDEMVCVIGPVGDDMAWPEPVYEVASIQNVAAMAGRGDESERRTEGVAGGMQLGRQAAFRASQALGFSAPFLSGAPAACW